MTLSAIEALQSSQNDTFRTASRLAVQASNINHPELRAGLATLVGQLAEQYEQFAQVAESFSDVMRAGELI